MIADDLPAPHENKHFALFNILRANCQLSISYLIVFLRRAPVSFGFE
jgi:hypothetical protein